MLSIIGAITLFILLVMIVFVLLLIKAAICYESIGPKDYTRVFTLTACFGIIILGLFNGYIWLVFF